MRESSKFLFSLVMAVYNTEEYVSAAIESVLKQTIGFQHVQLVLVDDGSTDGSGRICDSYVLQHPQSITVIHQEHRGVSAARNCGISAATGIYIGFPDSDDRLSANTLEDVYAFFCCHAGEVDVVSVPIVWFDGKAGGHILNEKYSMGDRVIRLADEPFTIQLSSSSCFMKRSLFVERPFRFDERLMVAEDAKLLQQILLKRQALGVVASGTYYYRRRSGASKSSLQQTAGTPHWYEAHINYYALETFLKCQEELGYVPTFVQTAVLYDLQWRLLELVHKQLPKEVNAASYRQALIECLRYIGPKVILAQESISTDIKLHLLRLKYGRWPDIDAVYPDMNFSFGDGASCARRCSVDFDFIWIDASNLHLEGRFSMPPCPEKPRLLAVWAGTRIELPLVESTRYEPSKILNEIIEDRSEFSVELSIPEGRACSLSFECAIGDKRFPVPLGMFGEFCPIGLEFKHAYYRTGRLRMSAGESEIKIERDSFFSRIGASILRFTELWRDGKAGKEAIFLRLCVAATKLFIKKPIWLISDRINTADDNGEALFRFLAQHQIPVHTRFLLRKNSFDYERLKCYGVIVGFFSFRHKVDHLVCEYLLSSQADHYTANPFGDRWIYYRDFQSEKKFVFLQHGVIKDDLSSWLNRYAKNIYGLVVSSQKERDSIIYGKYGYPAKNIWLTGLPRYDFLRDDGGKLITIMPTWRKTLMGNFSEKTGTRKLKDGFEKSKYFSFYAALLSDARLLDVAKKYGCQIAFKPHPMMLPYMEKFPHADDVAFLNESVSYQSVFANSCLILTDYSSVAFDFAYLRKPIIYCWPDHEEFVGGDHVYVPGYFSYEEDGFGEISHTTEETVDLIIEYLKNDCQLKTQYRKRIDAFFEYHDRNCCDRLVKMLLPSSGAS